jgi:hypothetical protein
MITIEAIAEPSSMSFIRDGAQRFPGAVTQQLDIICNATKEISNGEAGIRIIGNPALRAVLRDDGAIGRIVARDLGKPCQPVRAILFDKTADNNWALGWHQDRTICVKQRIDVDGFGPWTTKSGMLHVAPPFDILSRMVTVRVHLDDVPETNAPLLIAPGSHRSGRVPVDQIQAVVRRRGVCTCLATAGDVWLYATAILHASDRASNPSRRRVLQVDFSHDDLPGGLQWTGI